MPSFQRQPWLEVSVTVSTPTHLHFGTILTLIYAVLRGVIDLCRQHQKPFPKKPSAPFQL